MIDVDHRTARIDEQALVEGNVSQRRGRLARRREGLLRRSIRDELDSPEEPLAAHVADDLESARELAEPCAEELSHDARARDEIVPLDILEDGEGNGGRLGVTAVRVSKDSDV